MGAFGTAWRDVYVSGTMRLATTTLADNTLLNLSNISPTTGVNEGLQLPQTTVLGNPGSGAGYLGYDTDNFQLQYYDGVSWNAVVTSTASLTLQGAYNSGNVVTTTDARDVSFVLADTSTDGNFDINLQASSTTSGDAPSFSTSTASRGVLRLHKDEQNLMIVDSSGTSTIFGTLNVNYPYTPRIAADITGVGSPNPGVLVAGHYLYVADYANNGLEIYDITDPTKPAKVSTDLSTTIGHVYKFQLQGKYLYAGSASGVFIIDVSNVKAPARVTSLPGAAFSGCGNPSCDIYVSGNYLYIASPAGSPNNAFYIYDIRNPTQPVLLAKDQQSGGPISITGQGKYVYVGTNTTSGGGYIRAYDVTNPRRPQLVGTLTNSGVTMSQMVVRGRYLYVGTGSGLLIVDVSDPSTPTLKSTTATVTPSACDTRVDVQGRYAYLTGQMCTGNLGGFFVYDVSSSTKPVRLFGTQTPGAGSLGYMDGLAVAGRYAYVMSNSNDAWVWDINGAEISSANIGSLAAESVTVHSNLDVWNKITALGGVGIGGGLRVEGEVQILSYSSTTVFRIEDLNTQKQGDPTAAIAFQSATTTGLLVAASSTYAASGLDAMLRLESTRVSSSLFNFFTANVAATGSATATVFHIDGLGSVYSSGTSFLGGTYGNANAIVAHQISSGTLASFYSESSSTPNLSLTTSGTITTTGLNGLLRIDAVTSTAPTTFNFFTANWGSGANSATNTVFSVRGDGQIFSDAGTTITSPADLAELTKVKGTFLDYPDGTIVSQSEEDEEVAVVATPSIGNVLGVATDRGVFMGAGRWGKEMSLFKGTIHDFEKKEGVRRISVAGYVKMRVNDENGPILPGDPLGLSRTTPGEARRAKPGDLIVGMARASFPPKPDTTPPGAGSPSSALTDTTEETTEDTGPEETATVSHGLIEVIVGNGAGLAVQQAEMHNQGVVQTNDGTFRQRSFSLLTNGPTTVHQLIVKDVASFHGELRVKGHALFNEDTAGMGKFLASMTSVHVRFAESYQTAPVVTVTPESRVIGTWWVETVSPEGFTIRIEKPQAQTTLFHWIALAVKEKQLFVSDGTHGPVDKEYLWGNGNTLPVVVPDPHGRVEGDAADETTPVPEETSNAPFVSENTSGDVPAIQSADLPAVEATMPVGGSGGPEPDDWIHLPYLPFTRA
jgi:hypothetical protein